MYIEMENVINAIVKQSELIKALSNRQLTTTLSNRNVAECSCWAHHCQSELIKALSNSQLTTALSNRNVAERSCWAHHCQTET